MSLPTRIGYCARMAVRQFGWFQCNAFRTSDMNVNNLRCISLLSHPKMKEKAAEIIDGSYNAESRKNAEDLLKNSVTSIDDPRDEMNVWSSAAYPRCERNERNQSRKRVEPICDPRDTSIVLFPGQGSQYVGMGKALTQYTEAKEICDVASTFLGYDLLELCLYGPEEKLNRTEYSQMAVFVLSYAAAEVMKIVQPGAIKNCIATAGFSVGEITALVFSEALTFTEALSLVKVRAEAMQDACDATPGGMMTVFYGPDSRLEYACSCAIQWCAERGIEKPVCKVANYLFPHCKVIAGNVEALKFIEQNASKFKLRRLKRVPVSGAFHTPLMKDASDPFKKILKEIKIQSPTVPVYCNINAAPYRNARQIVELLPKQIYQPVKWEQTLHVLYERASGENFPFTYECGPGSSLKSCLKMVNAKAWDYCTTIAV